MGWYQYHWNQKSGISKNCFRSTMFFAAGWCRSLRFCWMFAWIDNKGIQCQLRDNGHLLLKGKARWITGLLFLITRYSYPGMAQAASANTSSLAFMVVLDLGSSPTPLSTSLLLALSKPGPAHHISTIGLPALGWLSRFYAIMRIWWTGRESNPRPEPISLCFIQR